MTPFEGTTVNSDSARAPRDLSRLLVSAVVLLITTLATSIIVESGAATMPRMWCASAIVALGTLVCAALGASSNRYPRWAYWGAALFMALGVLASPWSAIGPEAWVLQTRDSLWMFPWWFVLLPMLPAPLRGVCAPDRPAAAWMMLGTGALLGAMLQFTTRVHWS